MMVDRVPAPARSASARGWLGILLLGAGAFAVGTDAYIVAGLLPDMAQGLRVSQPAAGQTVAVFSFSYALLAPVLATATARLPRHRLLLAGLGVLVVANLVVAAASSLAVALVARAAAGAGAALYTPTAITVSAALVAESRRGRALVVVPGGLTIATVLGVPAGALVGQQAGWRAALMAVSALAAVALLGVLVAVPAVPAEPAVSLRDRLAVLRRGDVLAALAVTVLGIGGSYMVYTYASSVLQQGAGLPLAAVSGMLLLYGLGATAGNLLGGFGVDRFGARRMLGAAFVLQMLALAGTWGVRMVDGGALLAAAIAVVVWGAGTWMQTAPQQYRLIALAPQASRVVISLNASAIYVGIGLGGLIGGLVLSGLPAGFLPLAGAAVAAAALGVLLLSSDPVWR
jgi:MFS transporter, DHA1 family, inner membrane transport protein